MSAHVFVGPTLSSEDVRNELDAVVHPPAAAGDVYRVTRTQPRAIVVVDGFFERTPSVWHKEILWAMLQGVHVFGAASMGALRAAELAHYGMEGVGRIYEALRTGELCDDDEVAVMHATADQGYRPLSDAMVNIRATLAAALANRVVAPETVAALEGMAKRLFYADRSYERLIRDGLEAGLPAAQMHALRVFLRTGRVDLKRQDALEALRVVRDRLLDAPVAKRVSYSFEHTHAWDQLLRMVDAEGDDRPER